MSEDRATEVLKTLWPEWSGRMEILCDGPDTWVYRPSRGRVPAVVKLWPRKSEAKASRQALRQAELAAVLSHGPYRVPRVLWFGKGALVMQDAGGPDFRDRLEREAAGPLLRSAGEWLAAYHGLSLRERKFLPKGQVNWLTRLIEAVEAGERKPIDAKGLVSAARALRETRGTVRGLPATRAITHRDLTLSNLVSGPDDTVWGIDFENAKEDEPLRDVFSLALDVLCLTGDEAALASLREGYGDDVTAPEVRLFLQRCFAISVWANTPLSPSKRQRQRWEIARDLLERDSAVI
ncbi:aminoglycoside phosphotransferase family protein [Mameliella sp. CS4]|uniref:aminoglycoside phosphotransferase family protein n=1 Tax=Mameliella sp. CS4 TaxID=2862329 RepID=UPI001C5D5C23|nr:aminoglycoside phosphotransferase family protein [Mameliella sp. CS4]MBW4982262.1 aminoglycoside phosphotransferase family protein [Mameliella sp. CS4]